MAGIADLLNREGDLDALVQQILQEGNPQDIEYLRAVIMDNERANPIVGKDGNMTVPAVPVRNVDIHRYIQNDARLRDTNVGQNPAAYIHPAHTTHYTQTDIPSTEVEGNVVHGEYYPGRKPRWLWVSADQPSLGVADTTVHENVHANTYERPNYYPDMAKMPQRILENKAAHFLLGETGSTLDREYRKLMSHSPYLDKEIAKAVKDKMPIPYDIEYGKTEPAAWAAAREALLPSGEMPIQEEMNRQGLGALYAEMTTTGPVATRREPSLLERAKDLYHGEVDLGEPYELKGNPKKGKNKGGSVAAIVANNQRLRLRRRR